MLYFDFLDYEDFKSIFGMREHGNGKISRTNLILLSLYKDRQSLRNFMAYNEFMSLMDTYNILRRRRSKISDACGHKNRKNFDKVNMMFNLVKERLEGQEFSFVVRYFDLLEFRSLSTLKPHLFYLMGVMELFKPNAACHGMRLHGKRFLSDSFMTDDMEGLCEDGTINGIRYVNMEKQHVFKMRAGRMFKHLMECNQITSMLPYEMKIWLSEQFVADWTEYTTRQFSSSCYELHVDKNFSDIYSKECCAGYDENDDSFGSCMMDDEQWTFYRDSVKAHAAYLTDGDDMIVARCIIFDEVFDGEGKKWRLAERQYAMDCREDLKRQLVCALIRGGYIDGYKRVGSSCHDSHDFQDNEGNPLYDVDFHIECRLESGDTLSYQDSFKYYNFNEQIAYNDDCHSYDINLDTTESIVEGEYCEHRDAYYAECDTRYCENTDSREHVDDCIEIDDCWYYAGYECEDPESYDLHKCANCGDWFYDSNAYYSELTEEYYCSSNCLECAEESYKEDNFYYSDWDEEYFENEEDVITALVFSDWRARYVTSTISVESFNDLVENGEATEYMGRYYIDNLNFEGEPAHLALDVKAA